MRFLFYGLILFLNYGDFAAEKNGKITIRLIDLRSTSGQIVISIYDVPETFPKIKGMLEQKYEGPIPAKTMEITFERLEYGKWYAIAGFHDEDYNNKMTNNMFGFPKEGYCFSNNFRPKFRPPRWNECEFLLEKDSVIVIKMLY